MSFSQISPPPLMIERRRKGTKSIRVEERERERTRSGEGKEKRGEREERGGDRNKGRA